MVACAVINRANRTKSNKRRDRNIVSDAIFFKLPKVISAQCRRTHELSKKRRSMWLAKINRADPVANVNRQVCSEHFVTGKKCFLSFSVFGTRSPGYCHKIERKTRRSIVCCAEFRERERVSE